MTQEDEYLKRAREITEVFKHCPIDYFLLDDIDGLVTAITSALREEREKSIEECAKVADKIESGYRNGAWALGIPEAIRKLKGRE